VLSEFSYDWAKSGTASGRLHLTSTLRVDAYGRYGFEWRNAGGSPAPADLLIDAYSITAKQPVTLSRGLHSLSVSSDARGQTGVSRLFWTPLGSPAPPGQGQAQEPAPAGEATAVPASNLFDPRLVTPHGLTAAFRPGQGFDDPPTLERIDAVVSFYFQETPLPRPYTGEWTGRIYIPQAGDYTFGTQQISTSELSIDGQTVLSNEAAGNYQERILTLKAGWHDIRLRYKDHDNYSNVFLYWTPPGRTKSIIPSSFLWPLMAHYPDELQGRDAPTLDQSDGSSLPPDRITWFPPKP
jgi:PA14 domain